MRIVLPNSAYLGNIEGFLRKLDLSNNGDLEVQFNPSWISLHPMALSMAGCAGAAVRASGGTVHGVVPRVRSLPYLVRMKLFDHLDLDPELKVTEHESAGRFIPLTQIRTTHDLGDFIVNMIPLLHAEPDQVDPIQYVVSELVRNVLEHSDSPVGAFVSAQYFQNSQTLAIGVADAGIGVLQSMRKSHAVTSGLEALLLALRPGVTGTTAQYGGTEYNAGAGLFFTKAIACASRNFFVICSGDAMFKLRSTPAHRTPTINSDPGKDFATKHSDLPQWPGTAVGINITLEAHSVFSGLLGDIRNVYFDDMEGKKRSQKHKKPRFR